MSGTCAFGNLGAESSDSLKFLKSLKELKELRAQIHDAADYCERSYLSSEAKADVLDNTREYLCKAVVTVVDHLGSVSANLDVCIQKSDRVNETEHRINCLKQVRKLHFSFAIATIVKGKENQKLDSCGQYNHNFTLTKMRWSVDLPRYHARYILPPSSPSEDLSSDSRNADQPTDVIEINRQEFKTVEEMPLFMYTSPNKICLNTSPSSPLDIVPKETNVMPVRDGVSVAPKLIRNPSFHFQDQRRPGGIRRLILSVQGKSTNEEEIISILRRSKREPSRFLKLKQKLHLDFSFSN